MTTLSNFFANFYTQLYLLTGFAIFVLPFVIVRHVPKAWENHSYTYRAILFALIVVLWPISVVGFLIALYKIVRDYYLVRRLARDAMRAIVLDAIREDAKAALILELNKLANEKIAERKAQLAAKDNLASA